MKRFKLLSHNGIDFVVREDGTLCTDTKAGAVNYTWFSPENREEAQGFFLEMVRFVSASRMDEAEVMAQEILDLWDFDRASRNLDFLQGLGSESAPRIYRLAEPLDTPVSIPFDSSREARVTPAHLWKGKLSRRVSMGLTELVNGLELVAGGFESYHFVELIESAQSTNVRGRRKPIPDGTMWLAGSCGRYIVIIGVLK